MHVRGAISIEKSQIIEVICEFFRKAHQWDKLKIGAFKTSASLLIYEFKIHLLID